MSKVLVERPRVGGCGKERIRQNRRNTKKACVDACFDSDVEVESFNFRGMKRVHTSAPNSYDDQKELNENLRPLRRFLKSKIGHKWDDVYSEIMNGLNMNNAVQYHVWQHLVQDVQTKTYMEGNTVMGAGILGPEPLTNKKYSFGEEFYVDPRDGTLRCTKVSRNKYKYRASDLQIELNAHRYIDPKKPLKQYHKVNGIWYEFGFREATQEEKSQKSFGEMRREYDSKTLSWEMKWCKVLTNKFVEQIAPGQPSYYYRADAFWMKCKEIFGGPYLPICKHQISSKEVKRVEALIKGRKPAKRQPDDGVIGFRNGRKLAA